MSESQARGELTAELAHNYHPICELGKGGMASVQLALLSGRAGFQKLVALKLLIPNLSREPDFITMFLDEARLAARLSHPNVVHTYEVGCQEGQPFIAMEFVEGPSLSRLRRVPGGLPLPLHLHIMTGVLAGLHHAHELKDFSGSSLAVVHRDVSPQNVLVGYDGQVKVVDFGIAKAHTQLFETSAGLVKGKLGYMSPEQALGEPLDRRTDLFAVGVMLWEAATQTRLWPNISQRDRFGLLRAGQIPSVCEINPAAPAALDAICRRALAYSPDQRYQTAAELEAELEQLIAEPGLNTCRRSLVQFMSQHFEAERLQARRMIEEQLPVASGKRVRGPVPVAIEIVPEPATKPAEPEVPRTSITSWGKTEPPPHPSSAPPATSTRWLAFGAFMTTFVLLSGVWYLLGMRGTATSKGAHSPPVAAAPAPTSDVPIQVAPLVTTTASIAELPAAPPASAPLPLPRGAVRPRSAAVTRSTAPSAPEPKPSASLVDVTDFGGRR